MNEIEEIKQSALFLAVGDEDRIYCPFCRNDERSMKVTRYSTGIYYHCFRATCSNGRGFTGSLPSNLRAKEEKRFVPNVFTKETSDLSMIDIDFLYNKYKITGQEIEDNKISKIEGGFAFPLYNSAGYEWGIATKIMNPRPKQKKTILYRRAKTCGLHYAQPWKGDFTTVILTEGVLDAIKVNRIGQGVALSGTDLHTDQAGDLIAIGCKRLWICLDPDASHKAHKIRNTYGLFFEECKVFQLSADPKDLPFDQLVKELEI